MRSIHRPSLPMIIYFLKDAVTGRIANKGTAEESDEKSNLLVENAPEAVNR